MKKINEKLSEIFDVEPVNTLVTEPTPNNLTVVDTNNPVESDTEFARENIKTLIKKGSDAVDEILQVAKHSEHPRAYEVAGVLIKNMAELNKDLLELQKRKKELQISVKESNSKDVNIDKAVFVGSTAELMKLIKKEG